MRYGGYYGHGMDWGLSPGGWVLMILFWAAIFSLIAVGLVFLVRALSRPAVAHGPAAHAPAVHHPPPTAQMILDERLARGEIDVDEYRLRRDALRAPNSPDAPPPTT